MASARDHATAALLEDAAARARRYLGTLDDRGVAPTAEAIAALTRLDEPLPDGPTDAADVLARLDELVSPATMAMAGRRFFGFVIGGALPATLAANWLAGAWDQNAALARVTPGVSALEDIALRWLKDVLGLPASCEGAFVTGATLANFTALAAARHAVPVVHGAWPRPPRCWPMRYCPSGRCASGCCHCRWRCASCSRPVPPCSRPCSAWCIARSRAIC